MLTARVLTEKEALGLERGSNVLYKPRYIVLSQCFDIPGRPPRLSDDTREMIRSKRVLDEVWSQLLGVDIKELYAARTVNDAPAVVFDVGEVKPRNEGRPYTGLLLQDVKIYPEYLPDGFHYMNFLVR